MNQYGNSPSRKTGLALAVCVIVVGTWFVMSRLADRQVMVPTLNTGDFMGFVPAVDGFTARKLPVSVEGAEANILVWEFARRFDFYGGDRGRSAVLVRLAHGYNMPDCMRIKGYRVDLVADDRNEAGSTNAACQVWRLSSAQNETSIWVTSVLNAGDMSGTATDIRSFTFPKVDVPDDPGWVIDGITMAELRHPVAFGKKVIRSKWNASRCDILTFLRLKPYAGVDSRRLALVSAWQGEAVRPETEAKVVAEVEGVHRGFQAALGKWRSVR